MQASVIARGALARFGVKPYPLGLTYEVTWLCNLACSYCDRHTPMARELTREQIFTALEEFYALGMRDVSLDGWLPNELPWKFEAGTMPIAEAIGLHAAIDYLDALGLDAVREHEVSLTAYALRVLTQRHGDRITIFGPSEPAQRGGVISFSFGGIHPHDVSQVLDEHGVCVRAGHHCAKPLMRRLGVAATARASLYVYNDEADIDVLADALDSTADLFLTP